MIKEKEFLVTDVFMEDKIKELIALNRENERLSRECLDDVIQTPSCLSDRSAYFLIFESLQFYIDDLTEGIKRKRCLLELKEAEKRNESTNFRIEK